MNACRILIPVLLMAALLTLPAYALESEVNDCGYEIAPLPEEHQWMSVLRNYATITQGGTDRYTKSVSNGETDLPLDLNWGNSANSLSLTVSSPTTVVAIFHDADDGKSDGRIGMIIRNSGGLEPGTWTFLVHGESVHGTEDYTFEWY